MKRLPPAHIKGSARTGRGIDYTTEESPQRERGCSSKVAYQTRSAAKDWERKLRPKYGHRFPYACVFCGLWHLSSYRRSDGT